MRKNKIRRVWQIKGHCGPACLEMMFSYYDLVVSQDLIAKAAGIMATIYDKGSRIDQLNKAIEMICPGYVLLAKYNSDIGDLILLTGKIGLPVGVEWQGKFIDNEGKYFEEGHYEPLPKNWTGGLGAF